MEPMSAEPLAQTCAGQWLGATPDRVGPGVVFDSRQVTPGALFVAFAGEHADGHDYVASARERGAAAAMVARPVDDPLPQLLVTDQIDALTRLATAVAATETARGLVVIGITGSSGKTTTKDLLAQVLESAGETVSPPGSFNNELGMPVTTLRCDRATRWFVCEMGAQRKGEIERLCHIARPSIGVILNVGHAHLGEFGGVDAITEAKSELVRALSDDGWAVLNSDDPRVWEMREMTLAQVVATAVDHRPDHTAAVWADEVATDVLGRCSFRLHADLPDGGGQADVTLQFPGRHIVADAVAAAAAALCAGLDIDAVAAALTLATPRSHWRMALSELPNGALLVNDAYNANPDSVAAALAALATLSRSRRADHPAARTWFVLGDMLELGVESAALHRDAGRLAADVDELIAVGSFAPDVVCGAGHGRAVPDAAAAGAVLRAELAPDDLVLLKGSRDTGLGPLGDELAASWKGETA